MSKPNLIAVAWMWFCAAAIIVLCWLGIAKEYNSIPYWDMWDGTVAFLINFSQGSASERFSLLVVQHNEHRIVWSKLLFLADYALLNSSFILLFVFNALIPFLAIWIVTKCAAEKSLQVRLNVAAISVCFLFLLIQMENFGWAFQSQFFLAYFFPLLGYYCVIRFWSESQVRNGLIIFLAALASAFTMANGALFAFPIALLFVCKKQTRLTGVIAGAVLICVLALYLKILPYDPPPHHGDIQQSLLNNITGYVDYVLHYIGSPFGGGNANSLLGLFFVGVSLHYFWRALQRESLIDLRSVLLLYILYYMMTAAVTGIGRASFGVEQARADRYDTPSLLAWLSLLVLALMGMTSKVWHRIVYLGCLPFLAFVALGVQVGEFDKAGETGFSRTVAHLALHLKAEDEEAIEQVYPSASRAIDLYAKSAELGLQFTVPQASWTTLGTQANAATQCQGEVTQVSALPDGTIKITGWILNPGSETQSTTPVAVQDGTIVGIGYGGQEIRKINGAGFVVYAFNQDQGRDMVLLSSADENACELPL